MELLEQLRFLSDCTYISDLRTPCAHQALRSVLSRAHLEGDTLQWAHAVNYILGTSEDFSTEEEAKSFLLSHLK